MITVKVQKMGNSLAVVIPKTACRDLKISKGYRFEFIVEQDLDGYNLIYHRKVGVGSGPTEKDWQGVHPDIKKATQDALEEPKRDTVFKRLKNRVKRKVVA